MNAARKAHAEARKNCPPNTRPLMRRTKDGRSCSRPRKSPRKSGPKRARRTKAQAAAARKAHSAARKNCPPNTRPLKHRTKDGRSCSKPRKRPVKKSPAKKKMGWHCVSPYSRVTGTKRQRLRSCEKRGGKGYGSRQLCVEGCSR